MKGLDSVRTRHLADARARAEGIVRDAHRQADEILAQSAGETAELASQAEHAGETSADLDTSRGWATARRRARGIRLAAQREAYEELRTSAAAAVHSDRRSGALLQRVADEARSRLGPAAKVMIDSDSVRASRDKVHVRWSLADAVERSLSRLGPEIEALWR
jgi:vacuolar-type H+-ATPase subunit E/Vma4